MKNLSRCGVADELESAATEEQRKGHENPQFELAYFEAALILRRISRRHVQGCAQCQQGSGPVAGWAN
jgi:hypothetical protein